jgi:hypothetical protein
MGSQETTAWPLAVGSALKLAGLSPQPRMRPARSSSARANMRRYSSKERPQGITSFRRMVTVLHPSFGNSRQPLNDALAVDPGTPG